MDVVVVTGSSDHQWLRKGSSGHVVAQLLESPLPTPRRSCCGRSADTPAARHGCADASPQRGHVPFKWESTPGVPKSAAAAGGGKAEREVPLPKPPPGRCGTCHAARARARAYHHHNHHSNTTDSSSDQQDDGDTFSDALDRISSSDRLAALSASLSAIDGAVFGSRRSPSFIMDRFLPAANAIATTSADKHPRRPSPRRSKSKSKSKRDREAEDEAAARARFATRIRRRALAFEQPKHPPPHCQREHAAAQAQAQLPPCAKEEAQGEQMTPRACGFMFFVPWSAKPVLLGFQRSPARSRTTPRGDVSSVTTASSPPRRSVTLGDVLEKDRKLRDGGLSHWYDEKSGSGKEWANPGWGMALLGTSKRYCADARKALSRLTLSGMDSGDSPRISRERSCSKHKQAASMPRSTLVKMPPLSPPSESWLSNAGSNKS
ncbi:unnamed protein product [Miscanthus lutarioriparius]|uniref:Uncharacterized protein n=1 Tax=Miscanthus lutarioriparius TaxID=422564 RepID=A0A811RQF4_9POAL|nr:unnamed protein product [Miscanthus lutarioriparius]